MAFLGKLRCSGAGGQTTKTTTTPTRNPTFLDACLLYARDAVQEPCVLVHVGVRWVCVLPVPAMVLANVGQGAALCRAVCVLCCC